MTELSGAPTPEDDINPERAFWDRVIKSLETLSTFCDDLDMLQDIDDLQDGEADDALRYIYNHFADIKMEDQSSPELADVRSFLIERGILEGNGYIE